MANREEKIKTLLSLRTTINSCKEELNKRYNEYMEPLELKLKDLKEKETKLEDMVISDMIERGDKTVMFDDRQITWSTRKTMQVANEEELLNTLTYDKEVLKKAKTVLGLKIKDIKEKIVKVVLNRKEAIDIADSLYKLDGKLIKGVDIKETNYLTVK